MPFRLRSTLIAAAAALATMLPLHADTAPGPDASVARIWNEQLLDAIRADTARPTVHARNLWHLSLAMYDTWAAFDDTANSYLLDIDAPDFANNEAARNEAISHAAYQIIQHRFVTGPGGIGPGRGFTDFQTKSQMVQLGYDFNNTTTTGNSPAAIGNRIAQAVINFGLTDGAEENDNYIDPSPDAYTPVNPPMRFDDPGTPMIDPNRWQPLEFTGLRIDQNGQTLTEAVQAFQTPNWGNVKGFALSDADRNPVNGVHHDQGAPPYLNGAGDAEFRESVNEVLRYAALLDPNQSQRIDVSPASMGNRVLGTYEDRGHAINPYTNQPYEPEMVLHADWGRIVAEFWADGPDSEAPPGHWNTIANDAADRMNELGIEKRIGGTGPVVDDLTWDIKTYFALNAAVHDAGIAAWNHKGYYDYSRPVSMIRYMGQRGQASDPNLFVEVDGDLVATYHPEGLTLEPGLVEVITPETTAPGGRHEHLAGREGEIAILSWTGPPEPPFDDPTDIGGVDWILATEWLPYQRDTFVTPPFAAYVSGHSTFSRAAAEVLTAITGTEYFPGGLGTYDFPIGDSLFFEYGPSEFIQLQWATYYDAADEAGLSRLYGGIHVRADDLPGRIIGAQVGQDAWNLAALYFNGTPIPEPTSALLLLTLPTILRRHHPKKA
ncbi:vanadium-dependent haloperoxidase [Mucisphaera sp.]|uniref:vanadium-dependent haloperoxidase n=1 Tax=Mucisphaera sp. TaxID=2913024 RepID=UPI003D0D5977